MYFLFRERIPILFSIAFCMMFGMFWKSASAQNRQPQQAPYTPGQKTDAVASRVDWNDQTSVRTLADEVFGRPHGFHVLKHLYGISPDNIPPTIANMIKDRLSRWEIRHHQRAEKGISEDQITRVNNLLASKLGLPSYTQTNLKQVRYMRLRMIADSPVFMGAEAIRPNMKVWESISSEMSPLQGVNLLLELIGHKLYDEEFQVAPEEWDQTISKREAERIAALSAQPSAQAQKFSVRAWVNPKETEVRGVLLQRLQPMTDTEGLALLDEVFNILQEH